MAYVRPNPNWWTPEWRHWVRRVLKWYPEIKDKGRHLTFLDFSYGRVGDFFAEAKSLFPQARFIKNPPDLMGEISDAVMNRLFDEKTIYVGRDLPRWFDRFDERTKEQIEAAGAAVQSKNWFFFSEQYSRYGAGNDPYGVLEPYKMTEDEWHDHLDPDGFAPEQPRFGMRGPSPVMKQIDKIIWDLPNMHQKTCVMPFKAMAHTKTPRWYDRATTVYWKVDYSTRLYSDTLTDLPDT